VDFGGDPFGVRNARNEGESSDWRIGCDGSDSTIPLEDLRISERRVRRG